MFTEIHYSKKVAMNVPEKIKPTCILLTTLTTVKVHALLYFYEILVFTKLILVQSSEADETQGMINFVY